MAARKGQRRGLAALGATLALEGFLARAAVGVAAVTALGMAVLAVRLGRDGGRAPLELLPSLTSGAVAWTAGFLLAVAGASRGLRHDRERGVHGLVALRGADERSYLWGRTAGLAGALLVVVGGAVLIAGAAAALAARTTPLAGASLRATLASLAYAIAFAGTLAPLALAALGARSRAGGYLLLLALVFLPELFTHWTQQFVPESWADVLSIPTALASLRGALMPGAVDVLRFARAAFVLIAVGALAFVALRATAARASRRGDAAPRAT